MNHLYYGDNLAVLRDSIRDESVDLIYLDPPFNSNASYDVLFKGPAGAESAAQIEAFDDTWHWNDSAEAAFGDVMRGQNAAASTMLRAIRGFLGDNDMMAYLAMMAVRLIELHRVLKPTGSLYLHCDPTASHYLKILLDAVFGAADLISNRKPEVAMEIEDKERRSFLKDEYLFLQAQYEDFDRRSITIKGWVTSGSIVGLALSIDKAYLASAYVPVAMTIISLTVWYLEATWKLFQYALTDRIRIIEAYFRNDPDILVKCPDPFQIYDFWFRSYFQDEPIYEYERSRKFNYLNRPRNRGARLRSAAFQRFVHLPYSVIIVLSICALAIRISQT